MPESYLQAVSVFYVGRPPFLGYRIRINVHLKDYANNKILRHNILAAENLGVDNSETRVNLFKLFLE